MKPIVGPVVLLATLLAAPPALAGSGIAGSAHDFSSAQWNNTGEICITCHVPHDGGRETGTIGLLWNHSLSTATYQLYSSPSLDEQPEQPRGTSKMCLGCHDGTVALDSFGGYVGSTMMEGEAVIGTDLRMTHPISIRWSHQDNPDCNNCHDVHGGGPGLPGGEVPFFEGRVECASCHEPHDRTPTGVPHMLRKTMVRSELCFHCHNK